MKVFIDEHIFWKKHLTHAIGKINQGIGILGEPKHSKNLNILKIVCHSLIRSNLRCGALGPEKLGKSEQNTSALEPRLKGNYFLKTP